MIIIYYHVIQYENRSKLLIQVEAHAVDYHLSPLNPGEGYLVDDISHRCGMQLFDLFVVQHAERLLVYFGHVE